MRNIIIVQCMSTGINYVQDIIDRNCNPVILEVKPFLMTQKKLENIRKKLKKNIN